MKFSKEPYKIATKPVKGRTPVMIGTVGMVLKGTGIGYRKQDQRGEYIIDHLPSGHYIAKLTGSEQLAKKMCVELAKTLSFILPLDELLTKENKVIVYKTIENVKKGIQP
jgi:hypothetical protein